MSTIGTTEFERVEGASLTDIEELLEGRVFHVTSRDAWEAIASSGEIRPNTDGSLSTTFGFSRNSYFRKRGCVSLFDYRAAPSEEAREFRTRCWPFQPAEPGGPGIAILLLGEAVYERLIPWSRAREEGVIGEVVVPYVEAGYPGPISIAQIEQVVFFRRTEALGSLAAVLRKARRPQNAG